MQKFKLNSLVKLCGCRDKDKYWDKKYGLGIVIEKDCDSCAKIEGCPAGGGNGVTRAYWSGSNSFTCMYSNWLELVEQNDEV